MVIPHTARLDATVLSDHVKLPRRATVNPPHPMMEVITHIVLCGEPYVFSIQNYIRFDLLSFDNGISVASNARNHSVNDTAFPLTAQQH